jgi:hypothetical protein
MPDEKQYSASDMLRTLHEFIQEPEEDVVSKPIKEVQAELARRSIDATTLIARAKQQVAKARADHELGSARVLRARTLERFAELQGKIGRFPAAVRERVSEVLTRMSLENPTAAAAYFSKFEEANEADLQSLLDDLKMLDESADHKNTTDGT